MTGARPQTLRRVEKIRVLLAREWTQRQIGLELGISQSAVCDLIKAYIPTQSKPRAFTPKYIGETLYDRWVIDHDIQGIGERAVRETA